MVIQEGNGAVLSSWHKSTKQHQKQDHGPSLIVRAKAAVKHVSAGRGARCAVR
jgi:hypothetical protein